MRGCVNRFTAQKAIIEIQAQGLKTDKALRCSLAPLELDVHRDTRFCRRLWHKGLIICVHVTISTFKHVTSVSTSGLYFRMIWICAVTQPIDVIIISHSQNILISKITL
ncbi:hypothetical protein AB3S75_021239 [Citrus x aurantiifolia]